MIKQLFIILAFSACLSITAEDFRTLDGKEYKNVSVCRVTPEGIEIMFSTGIKLLKFKNLPESVRKKYHYSPEKAAEYEKTMSKKRSEWSKKQQELEKQRREKTFKYEMIEGGHLFINTNKESVISSITKYLRV